MEFQTLGTRERKLLFKILDIDIDKLKCQYCDKKLTYDKCGIFPSVNTTSNASILCNSPLCMSEYFSELEANNDETDKRITELEHMAHLHMTGEDVENQLDDIDPKLRKEDEKLMEEM